MVIRSMAIVTVLLMGATVGAYWRGHTPPDPSVRASSLIGLHLPSIEVFNADGASETLQATLAGRPAFIYIVTGRDCLLCGSYGDELRILAREYPGHVALLVGVGDDHLDTAHYARRHRVDAVFDPPAALLSSLRITETPLFLALDREARILLTDSREGPASTRQPISHIITTLGSEFVHQKDP